MIEDIRKELESLSARKIELESELARGDLEVSSARESLLQGTVGAVQTVTVAHSSAEALRAAVNALDKRIEQKRAELATALDEARRESEFEHRLALMQRGEDLLTAYLAVRDRTNEALKKHAEEMSAAFAALQANRNAWLASIDITDVFSFDEFIAAGVDPTSVRAQWDGTNGAASDDKAYVLPHVLPFEDVLRIVFHVWHEATKEKSDGQHESI